MEGVIGLLDTVSGPGTCQKSCNLKSTIEFQNEKHVLYDPQIPCNVHVHVVEWVRMISTAQHMNYNSTYIVDATSSSTACRKYTSLCGYECEVAGACESSLSVLEGRPVGAAAAETLLWVSGTQKSCSAQQKTRLSNRVLLAHLPTWVLSAFV